MKKFITNTCGFLCGLCTICTAGTAPEEIIDLPWTLAFIAAAAFFGWAYIKLGRAAK